MIHNIQENLEKYNLSNYSKSRSWSLLPWLSASGLKESFRSCKVIKKLELKEIRERTCTSWLVESKWVGMSLALIVTARSCIEIGLSWLRFWPVSLVKNLSRLGLPIGPSKSEPVRFEMSWLQFLCLFVK